jgi:hypothetical protein
MKKVGITIAGNRYEVKLEENFAAFVEKDLVASGINLHTDNKPEKILKAYLKIAQQTTSYEDEIELLIETLEAL